LGTIALLNNLTNQYIGETISIKNGGTGATNSKQARKNLGISLSQLVNDANGTLNSDPYQELDYTLQLTATTLNLTYPSSTSTYGYASSHYRDETEPTSKGILKLTFTNTTQPSSQNNYIEFTAQADETEVILGTLSGNGGESISLSSASKEILSILVPTLEQGLSPGDVVGIVAGEAVRINASNEDILERVGVVSSHAIISSNYLIDPTDHVQVTLFGTVEIRVAQDSLSLSPSVGEYAYVSRNSATQASITTKPSLSNPLRLGDLNRLLGVVESYDSTKKTIQITLPPSISAVNAYSIAYNMANILATYPGLSTLTQSPPVSPSRK